MAPATTKCHSVRHRSTSATSTSDALLIVKTTRRHICHLDCNQCERCRLGRENLCVSAELMGRDVDGTLREFLPIVQTHAFKLPDRMSFEEGALLQPLSTVVHGQVRTEIKPSESVAVLGLGASGLMHVQISKLAGAYPIIAVGRSGWKMDLAEQMGADFLVNAAQSDPVAEGRRLTGSHLRPLGRL